MAGDTSAFDDFFAGQEETTTTVDTRADGRLLHIPVGRIAANTVNPRTDFGTRQALEELGNSLRRRQQQPILVVSKAAYVKLWDHGDQLGDVDFVIVCGERRYKAAELVGLDGLDVVVNDDVAASRKTFLNAVVSENVDRQNFDAIEEAYAVQALVEEAGSNRDVAKHFGRADGWVTQRVCLTYLSPVLQEQVRKKELSLELARSIGQKAKANGWDAAQQMQWLTEERERIARERDAKREARKAGTQPSTPVMRETPETGGGAGESFTAVKLSASSTPTAEAEVPAEVVTAVNGSPASGERTTPELGPTEATTQESAAEAADTAEVVTVVNGTTAASTTKPAAVPDPRAHERQTSPSDGEGSGAGEIDDRKQLPYDNGPFIAMHLSAKMDAPQYAVASQLMNRQSWDKLGADETFAGIERWLEQAVTKDPDRLRELVSRFMERAEQPE
ncbi:ParB/RepB/Spo0J family partition protein [Streptomyces sp. NPDC059916]|uniref:ParB/RepB/Spo0J family partition protein n=1 Tax=Streptomyces sp. NPDC059916 TaxID=3347001 RepID=UPI0036904795